MEYKPILTVNPKVASEGARCTQPLLAALICNKPAKYDSLHRLIWNSA